MQEMVFSEELGSARDESDLPDDKETDVSVATETTDGRSGNDDSYSIRSKTTREPLTLMVSLCEIRG
jgi:hypothetical protein